MNTYYRNESDPPPGVQVVLDIHDTGTLLSIPQWYITEWTTDPSLYNSQNIFGRTEDNFYPLNTEENLQFTLYRNHVSRLPDEIWTRFKNNDSNRNVYVRVGAGNEKDIYHQSWHWKILAKWVINHNPDANAGAPIEIKLSNNVVSSDIQLSAAESNDADPSSQLSYEWEIIGVPTECLLDPNGSSFIRTLQQNIQGGGETEILIPSGTTISEICQGSYEIELKVEDDDPPSSYGTIGRDITSVKVILGKDCQTGICITNPTTSHQAVIDQPGEDDVEIMWQLSPSVFSVWEQNQNIGTYLKLEISSHDSSSNDPPIYYDFEFRPKPSGAFIWSGFLRNDEPAPSDDYDIRIALFDGQGNIISAGEPTEITMFKAIGVDQYGYWSDLINHRPPHNVQLRVNEPMVAGYIHAIEKATSLYSATNLDYYPIKINKLPIIDGQRSNSQQFLEHIRKNINSFVDPDLSVFEPYGLSLGIVKNKNMWDSNTPLGAILGIDLYVFTQLLGIDDGSVICSHHDITKWRFSTLHTLLDSNHPVSGNREWGFKINDDGSYTFFTRAVDRVTSYIDLPILAYTAGGFVWESFQEKVANFVNQPSSDGEAIIMKPVIQRPSWEELEKKYFNPKTTWLPGVTS